RRTERGSRARRSSVSDGATRAARGSCPRSPHPRPQRSLRRGRAKNRSGTRSPPASLCPLTGTITRREGPCLGPSLLKPCLLHAAQPVIPVRHDTERVTAHVDLGPEEVRGGLVHVRDGRGVGHHQVSV